MKRILMLGVVVLGLIGGIAQPAQAAKSITVTRSGIGDCPIFIAGVAVLPRVLSTQPFNLAFGGEIGNHKAPFSQCATTHELRITKYLYTLPIGGPRTLVALANNTAFCFECTDLQSSSSAVLPPGYYQLVVEYSIDDVEVASLSTPNFLYDGFDVTPFTPLA